MCSLKKETNNNIANTNTSTNVIFIKKQIPQEYKIVSKIVSFDWEKSFISI